MPLKEPYNRLDSSFFRSVYLGLLYEFMDSVWIPGYEMENRPSVNPTKSDLIREYNEKNRVFVPFFLNMGYAEERFWQDNFILGNFGPNTPNTELLTTPECRELIAEGAYEMIPRGILSPTGIDIDSGSNTNPYSRGIYYEYNPETCEYVKYNSKIRNLRVKLPCEGKIYVANHNDAWFIVQRLLEIYVRLRKFNFVYKGVRGEGQMTLAKSFNIERLFEFTYPETNKIIVNFNLDVNAIMPIYDPYKEFKTSNVINNFSTIRTVDGLPPERVPTNPDLKGPRRNPYL